MDRARDSDVVVMTAAVADYTPVSVADAKIKKSEERLSVEMERTRDILREVCGLRGERVVVGFVAETGDAVASGTAKREDKGADLMVVNDVSLPGLGFDSVRNKVSFIDERGTEDVAECEKTQIASLLLDRVESMLDKEKE
jgi:phosphopantothenoylcysteine decarboxylase/phosphopantothenate--cysteine ligase